MTFARRLGFDRTRLARTWQEYAAALLFFLVLSLLISWPTVAHFTGSITSDNNDARHELWLLWHTKEALLGRQPLYGAPLLFYPRGATLLTHSTGPVTGLFALPFWPLGPEAAYNATLLISLTLSGYAMYVLARGLRLPPGVALFAGCMVLAAPMTLAGLHQHLTKVFVAGMPLVLLALLRTLDPRRSRWWAAGFGAALLFVLLHNGYQFVYISLAVAFWTLASIAIAPRGTRLGVAGRAVLAATSALLLVGPLLFLTLQAARDPDINVDVRSDAFDRPDLVQFMVPDRLSLLGGEWTSALLGPLDNVTLDVETSVSLPWIGLILCLPVLLRGSRAARCWLLFAVLCVVFALGPSLQVYGRDTWTAAERTVWLPYALLARLPGLEFMRTPGRFMQIGAIGFGIAAGYGLLWLTERLPRWRHALVGVAIALLLLQNWPRPFESEQLRPVPEFYRQIAADPEPYGVFDLPLKFAGGYGYGLSYITHSAYYQLYQMTHHKGIHGAYLSRTYLKHPLFSDLMSFRYPDLLINGVAAPIVNFEPILARNGYRYVVLHSEEADTEGAATARELVDAVFGAAGSNRQPIEQDELVTVYQVSPAPATTEARLASGWLEPEDGWHWATSPATITIDSPCRQPATLEIVPFAIHGTDGANGLSATGMLGVKVDDQDPQTVPLTVEQPSPVSLTLDEGSQTISLELEAGNFQPSQYGGPDERTLSFAIRTIDLRVANECP